MLTLAAPNFFAIAALFVLVGAGAGGEGVFVGDGGAFAAGAERFPLFSIGVAADGEVLADACMAFVSTRVALEVDCDSGRGGFDLSFACSPLESGDDSVFVGGGVAGLAVLRLAGSSETRVTDAF